MGVLVELEGMEDNPAHTPATKGKLKTENENYFDKAFSSHPRWSFSDQNAFPEGAFHHIKIKFNLS